MSSSEDEFGVCARIVLCSLVSEDVKIDVARQNRREIRKERARRMKQLRATFKPNSLLPDHTNGPNNQATSSSQSTLEEQNSTHRFMDLDLYRAATKGDVDGFIDALERISKDKELPLHAIFKQVSPSGNTLLHIAAASVMDNRKTVRLIAYHAPWLLSQKNSKGDTPLHILARAESHDVGNLIFRLKTLEPLSFDNGGHMPDSTLTETLIRLLLKDQNEEGNTCVHEALIHGHEGLAFLFLTASKLEPEPLFCLNKEEKSLLYLATEACSSFCIRRMLEPITKFENQSGRLRGKSPVHTAIMKQNTGVLDLILERKPDWIIYQDEEQRTPLHWAASMRYLEGVRNLLGKNTSTAMERDKDGFFPIHMASAKGHVHVIQELLQHWPYVEEMQNSKGQNILHVAATSGKLNVIKYILETPGLESLINERDKDGNTPLHLATMHWHPKLVSALTWDNKVDLRLINNDGLTALDIAECYMENSSTFRQRLTWTALKAAGVPRNPNASDKKQVSNRSELQSTDNYKDRVNTLLLVSTLVATVTFAAGFTIPGGYNSSGEDQGMATMLSNNVFHAFIFCNTIAMFSSIFVAVTLIWAQLGDIRLVLIALRAALLLLGVALATMSLAFLFGIYLVVSKLSWLANAIMIMGLVFLVAFLSLYFFLCFPMSSSNRIMRYISYYPFCLMLVVTGSAADNDFEE
ncbi:hypothetical protein CMV_026704 [Castanea mollissima]|uniref:PGG domain-containing protein n=1 Tax=Castanea mollissima TaxID=60419 RepID=A0A8J4QAP7_9ROSI|nr:hypothetical protein CMV_026704 [Castanea mollissima]